MKKASKKGLSVVNLLYLNKEELMGFGFTDPESDNISFVTICAIKKIAPNETTENTQGKNDGSQMLPPPWRKVDEKKIYFNAMTLDFQTKKPEITVDEIEQYDANGVIVFLKRAGFQSKTLGKDIFSVFKKKKVTGEDMLKRSYNELVSLKIPKEEARKLRLILAPLHTKATLVGLDTEDTCIWAQALNASNKSLNSLAKHEVTGKKLTEITDLVGFLKGLDITEGMPSKSLML